MEKAETPTESERVLGNGKPVTLDEESSPTSGRRFSRT
jgi:hypothetical protein